MVERGMSEALLTLVQDLSSKIGETVTLRGWIENKNRKGKIAFWSVRDGSGTVQVVASVKDVSEDAFDLMDKVPYESTVTVTGVVSEDKRSPIGVEIHAKDVSLIQAAEEPYPIPRKESGPDFLHDHRHLWLRSPRQRAILKVRSEVSMAIRDFFHRNDYVLTDSPILTGSIGEEAGTLFATEYFKEGMAYLAQTGQLYLESTIGAFGKVYCFGPTFRAEKSVTRRHLTEFWMIEAETAFCEHDQNVQLQEDLVMAMVSWVLERCQVELQILGRDLDALRAIQAPFVRLTYSDAIEFLKAKGSEIEWGQDLGAPDEQLISEAHDRPVFVMNYPKSAKAFYMKENPDDPRTVLCADLLATEGRGEIIGGSSREDDLEKLLARIHEQELPEEAYGWYLDLRRYGSQPHAGFGLGLERTVAWLCGIEHIREAIPFPRLVNRLSP